MLKKEEEEKEVCHIHIDHGENDDKSAAAHVGNNYDHYYKSYTTA